MRRIALVSEHASPLALAGSVDSGGQNVYVAHVARQLAARGHEVDVYTRRDDPLQPLIVHWQPGVRVIHVPAGPARYLPKEELLPCMAEFRTWMMRCFGGQDELYDAIHANFFMSAMAALPVARYYGIPLAVTFHALGKVRRLHQQEADRFPDSRFAIEEEIVREADCIVAECPQDRRDLIDLYGADPARIEIVPCGYDPAEMAPMARLRARRALAALRGHHGVDARLAVVGGSSRDARQERTPEVARLKAVARDCGVLDRVDFVGRRNRLELREYYCASDVFATTPWYEPFGITPVEAMACARPVVGSRTGGIRYTVEDGRTGFLVPPRDPAALAARLAVLARDPALARRMGEAGARRAQRLFTWESVGRELDLLFARLSRAPAVGARRAAAAALAAPHAGAVL